jgi:hypothetical protein
MRLSGLIFLLRMKLKNWSGSSSKRDCTTEIFPPVKKTKTQEWGFIQRLLLDKLTPQGTTDTYFVLLSWGQTALYLVQLHDQSNLLSEHYQHPIPVIVKPSTRSYQYTHITKHNIPMLRKKNYLLNFGIKMTCKITMIHYDFNKFTIISNMHTKIK